MANLETKCSAYRFKSHTPLPVCAFTVPLTSHNLPLCTTLIRHTYVATCIIVVHILIACKITDNANTHVLSPFTRFEQVPHLSYENSHKPVLKIIAADKLFGWYSQNCEICELLSANDATHGINPQFTF